MPIALSVITPEHPVVQIDADSVVLPGEVGQFGVLPNHEAFLAPLRDGILRYEVDSQSYELWIGGGFAQVTGEQVNVLADSARAVS